MSDKDEAVRMTGALRPRGPDDYEKAEKYKNMLPHEIAALQQRAAERVASPHSAHGMRPIEFKVVVLPNKVDEVTKGGIRRPDTVIAQMQVAVCKGRLVAVSPWAFTYFDTSLTTYAEVLAHWPETPKIGDMVLYGRYCGGEITGKDGQIYRIMNDKDILALADEEVQAVEY